MSGTIYAPSAQLVESGNAQINLALVVDKLTLSGNAIVNSLALAPTTVPTTGALTANSGAGPMSVNDKPASVATTALPGSSATVRPRGAFQASVSSPPAIASRTRDTVAESVVDALIADLVRTRSKWLPQANDTFDDWMPAVVGIQNVKAARPSIGIFGAPVPAGPMPRPVLSRTQSADLVLASGFCGIASGLSASATSVSRTGRKGQKR